MEKNEQKNYLTNEEKETLIKFKIKGIKTQYQGLNLIEQRPLKGGTGIKYWM